MLKVLYVNGGIMDRGGVSMSMMNFYRHIDPNEVHIDFLVHGKQIGNCDDEILNNGGKIFHITPRSVNIYKNAIELKRFFRTHNYDIVHSQADTLNAHILKYAKRYGVKVRISHSHNTNYTIQNKGIKNKLRIAYNEFNKRKIKKYATYMCGCSVEAFKWLHGDVKPVNIIHNAIDVEKFEFNPIIRNRIREQYNIGVSFLIGNVGRFDYQKNQLFLIDVFKAYLMFNPSAKLMLVGNGKLKDEIVNKIKFYHLENKVILTGQVDNPHDYYNAFDVFCMPSLFEGLGMVVIEAQYNGLQCIVSNNIPLDTKISNNIKFIDLQEELWVDSLNNITDHREVISNNGYNIQEEAKRLTILYKKLYD